MFRELLEVLRTFLGICRDRNLKVSIPKSTFFSKELKWCGRVIDEHGVRIEPRRTSGLRDISKPETAAEICEFIHCITWMSMTIPDYAEQVAPLRDLLEETHRLSGSRNMKSIQKNNVVTLGWGHKHDTAFQNLENRLRQAVKLSHRDPSKELCVYTDASDRFWTGVLTRCEPAELTKAVPEQRHEPLAFLRGEFKGPELAWTTIEKERYAIWMKFRRADYMLLCEEARVFTDHRNLLFCYSQTTLEPSLGRHKIMKVVRWAIYLSPNMSSLKRTS